MELKEAAIPRYLFAAFTVTLEFMILSMLTVFRHPSTSAAAASSINAC